MVKTKENQPYQLGIDKLKEFIDKRIQPFAADLSLDTDIFDQVETRIKLCTMTGGHLREMMLLMQTAMDWIDDFPITAKAINRAINDARDNTYRSAVDQHEWEKLAQVYLSKTIPNEEEYRSLLFRRCLLEYRDTNQKGDICRWHDVHPLIEDIAEFQVALGKINNEN